MEVTTCTIMYNASLDLLNINLQDNYKFNKRFLREQTLSTFFDETPMGFRRKYQEACLNNDLYVITAESHFNIPEQEIPDSEQQYELELLTQLDRQIRLIRLVCDCTLHFSEFRYILTSSENIRTIGTIPHIDCVIKKTNLPFSITDSQLEIIQNCFNTPYPFINDWVYGVYDFFDSSFLLDEEKALIILITAFEMVFLDNEKCKKEKLAKRSAIYFGNSDKEIREIYRKIKQCYSERSNYVHEGKPIQDSECKLHFLRNLLRKFILDSKDATNIGKKELIPQLKAKVEACHLFPGT